MDINIYLHITYTQRLSHLHLWVTHLWPQTLDQKYLRKRNHAHSQENVGHHSLHMTALQCTTHE